MRLTGASEGQVLGEAWAYLTRTEATQLYQALEYYLEDDQADPGWHHHVGEANGPQLTIGIEADR